MEQCVSTRHHKVYYFHKRLANRPGIPSPLWVWCYVSQITHHRSNWKGNCTCTYRKPSLACQPPLEILSEKNYNKVRIKNFNKSVKNWGFNYFHAQTFQNAGAFETSNTKSIALALWVTSPQYSLINSFLSAPSFINMPHPATSEGAIKRCFLCPLWIDTFLQLQCLDSRCSPKITITVSNS